MLIALNGISKSYQASHGAPPYQVLKDANLSIDKGEMVAIKGSSGAGKSTLMNILGCLDCPTSGVYRLHGRDVSSLPPDELAKVRGEEIGFVFQGFQLIPRLTAIENVMLPLMLQGVSESERRARAEQLLLRVGLHSRMHHLPAALSGGQQQRVAIARALIRRPALILADEPTGSLDPDATQEILALLEDLHRAGQTILLITHNPTVAARAERRLTLQSGKIVEEE